MKKIRTVAFIGLANQLIELPDKDLGIFTASAREARVVTLSGLLR
jgi:hypothetical protein